MRTFDFFNNIATFKEVVPGVEGSTTLSEMQASYERAKQIIVDIIGQTIWDALKADFTNPQDADLTKAVAYLQGAVGNRAYFHHLIFKVVGKKKEEVSFYKNEIQMMQETYLDNYWLYMDKLLTFMDSKPTKFASWASTEMYKTRDALLIKTASDFSRYCGLDDSAYFFNRTIHLQLEVTDTEISSRKITAAVVAAADVKLARNIYRAIAYQTAADAIYQFDFADLPRSVRNSIYTELGKKGAKDESEVKKNIAGRFEAKAINYFQMVDLERNQPDQDAGESTDIYIPETDINSEDNSHYLMT